MNISGEGLGPDQDNNPGNTPMDIAKATTKANEPDTPELTTTPEQRIKSLEQQVQALQKMVATLTEQNSVLSDKVMGALSLIETLAIIGGSTGPKFDTILKRIAREARRTNGDESSLIINPIAHPSADK